MSATLDMQHVRAANAHSGLLRALRDAFLRMLYQPAAGLRVVYEIPKHRTLRLPPALVRRIECLEGCVWVTLDHDRRDVVITAGETFIVDRSQRVLVHAMDPSRVRLVAAGQ